jgi:hypothetical protein
MLREKAFVIFSKLVTKLRYCEISITYQVMLKHHEIAFHSTEF